MTHLGGTWSFTTYTSGSGTGGTAAIRANLYRIDSSGAATLLYTTGQAATNAVASTSYAAQSWTFAVPSGTLLSAGQRWGVELQLNVTSTALFQSANVGLDTIAQQSRLQPALSTLAFTATPTPPARRRRRRR